MPTLHWIGKEKVVRHHHEVPFKTLRREYEFVAPEVMPANSTGNRIIHGDNL
jgi:adenine-specific DNA-methyltransferase